MVSQPPYGTSVFARAVLKLIRVMQGQVRFDLAVMSERHRAWMKRFDQEHGRR